MVNQESFERWLDLVQQIKTEEQLLKIYVETYFMIYEKIYLEYIEDSVKKLRSLCNLRQQYFNSAFVTKYKSNKPVYY